MIKNYTTIKSRLTRSFLALSLATLSVAANAQCNCEVTIDVSQNESFPAGVSTVCIEGIGNWPNGTVPANVCISANAKITILNDVSPSVNVTILNQAEFTYNPSKLPGGTITVESGGKFLNPTYSWPSDLISDAGTIIDVRSGGYLEIGATRTGDKVLLKNAGETVFKNSGGNTFQGVFVNSGSISTAPENSGAIFVVDPQSANVEGVGKIENSGVINVAHFENHTTSGSGKSFSNSGEIIARGVFYNHGRLSNTSTGVLRTTCSLPDARPYTNYPANAFVVGDKDPGTFINAGVFDICGLAKINGNVTFDGGKVNVGGDLEILKPMNGSNGKLTVGGEATANGDGYYGNNNPGGDMVFYSPGTNGSTIIGNPPTAYYTSSENPLPVVLKNFIASLDTEGSVKISWSTTQEANSASFEVERSYNGKEWTNIGSVPALGNSAKGKQYSMHDNKKIATTAYYRLKMIDLDSRFDYSAIRSVSVATPGEKLFLYPNPTKSNIVINDKNWAEAKQVFVYNSLGKVVLRHEAASLKGQEINTADLAAGVYYVRIIYTNGTKSAHPFTISK